VKHGWWRWSLVSQDVLFLLLLLRRDETRNVQRLRGRHS
jgi:hypothetical protein